MKRLLFVLTVLLPVAAVAQENSVRPLPDGVVTPSPGSGVMLIANNLQQTPAPARGGSEPRRRPSMVGYVDDASVNSQFRVRFDAGRHIHYPDRAEFFYGKCGCYRGLATTNPAWDSNAAGPGPGVVTDLDFNQLFLMAEYAMMRNRGSLFVELPVRWVKPGEFVAGTGSFGDSTGISDLRFGAKFSLYSDELQQLTGKLTLTAPTGDALKGLGTDHWSVEPVLLYSHTVMGRMNIEGEFGEVIPTDGSAGVPTTSPDKFSGKVVYYGIGPSFDVYSSERVKFSPVIEFVGWRVVSGFVTGPAEPHADGTSIANLKVGARVVVRGRDSVYFGWGHHLTDAAWYENIVRVEYRRAF